MLKTINKVLFGGLLVALIAIFYTSNPSNKVQVDPNVKVLDRDTFVDNKELTNLVNKTKKILKTISIKSSNTVFLDTEVNYSSVERVVSELKKLDGKVNGPIYLLIDSPGGSIIDGAAILSQMEGMKTPVYTVCIRMCASMAAVIHQYGKKRLALDRSLLMFHPASGGVRGQIPNMLSLLKMVQRYYGKMNTYIIKRSGIDANKFAQLTAYELWLEADDAKALNFVDDIVHINDLTKKSKFPFLTSSKFKQVFNFK